MIDDANDDQIAAPQPVVRVDELLAGCHDLLKELEDFQKFLVVQKKEHVVEIRQFRNSVVSELKSLEKVSVRRYPTVRFIANRIPSSPPQTPPLNAQSTPSAPRISPSTTPSGPLQKQAKACCSLTSASTGNNL